MEETLEAYKQKMKVSKQYTRLTSFNLLGSLLLPFLYAVIAWPIWNGIVAPFLHLPEVTYWQAWGILMVKGFLWPAGKYAVEKAS